MKYVSTTIAFSAVAVMTVSACAGDSDGGTTAQFAHPNDSTTWLAAADTEWAEAIQEDTDGEVEVNIHWAGALADAFDAPDAMGSGAADLGILFPMYSPSQFPAWNWLTEYAFESDTRPVIGDMQAYAAMLEISLQYPAFQDEFREQGIEPLLPMFEMNSGYYLLCNEPVTSVSDAEGNTVRTAGGPWEREARALGMAPTQIGAGEMYEALQRGTIDCSINPLRDMVSFDLLEVATDITMDSETMFTAFSANYSANQEWWDSLDEEVQDQLWETFGDHAGRFVESGLRDDFLIREASEEYGVTIHEMESDMRDAIEENQQERLDDALADAPSSLDGQEEEILEAYSEAMDKWEVIVAEELGYAGQVPETWQEVISSDLSIDDIDFDPFAERIWDEVLVNYVPSER